MRFFFPLRNKGETHVLYILCKCLGKPWVIVIYLIVDMLEKNLLGTEVPSAARKYEGSSKELIENTWSIFSKVACSLSLDLVATTIQIDLP